jgi:uncharacterized protein
MTKLQVTIYLKETEMNGDIPLYESIVRRLLNLEIAGTTVLRGMMGYGRHGHVHRRRLLGVSDDHPVLVIAIDEPAKIQAVLPELRKLYPEGLITLQEVTTP